MPGDLHGKDYYAGVNIERQTVTLESMDSDTQRPDWGAPDIAGFASRFVHAVWDVLEPGWWLLAILLFELLRADPGNWPGHPMARRRDQWRLKPFRGVSSASAPAPDRA